MKKVVLLRVLFTVFLNILILNTPALAKPEVDGIYVNGVELSFGQTIAIKMAYDVPDGRYWYDAKSGLWGREGKAPKGRVRPGIEVGGPLQSYASGGNSGVFINGREIPHGELSRLEENRHRPPSRYWMDERGNIGYEGESAIASLKITIQKQYKSYN